LEGGLLSEGELKDLLWLIREPDSHFLKVPSLPFHSLISILAKFPADVDSRVFWSGGLRDLLYDVTFAAIQVLLGRVPQNSVEGQQGEYNQDLVNSLVRTAMSCQAFTDQQLSKLSEFSQTETTSSSFARPASVQSATDTIETPTPQQGSLSQLAHEFGVDTKLVKALAERMGLASENGSARC